LNSSKSTIKTSGKGGGASSVNIDKALEEEFAKLDDFTQAIKHLKNSIIRQSKIIQRTPDKPKS